ncbi:low molecular weight phosphotyrosine protein phosphatase [Alcanivorax sp. JB21]|uniref:low molecular weight protein-tyrosine-phosphatase n=1 Tax=Alcanivorax limicola TaxID=2874102 RepID=UPI001CC13BCC|nr:low molecular weight protein-tyrosine-phosphatase [Alcanivorax limicola]MBZ2188014.1 low molecular weight phosphotyrosine protein phosphatase [Alcanivorax limicola]
MSLSVLFVCLGNICRSPTAEGVFRERVQAAGLEDVIQIDSAGTGDWHLGKAPDQRMTRAAAKRGYDLSPLRARLVTPADMQQFDYVLAMDHANLRDLQAMLEGTPRGHLGLFLDFHPQRPLAEVPDPYYGGEAGFEQVLDLVESACDGLLAAVREQIS